MLPATVKHKTLLIFYLQQKKRLEKRKDSYNTIQYVQYNTICTIQYNIYNTICTIQYLRNRKWLPMFIQPDANTRERVCENLKGLFAPGYINTGRPFSLTTRFSIICGYLYLNGFNLSRPSADNFPFAANSQDGQYGYMLKSPHINHGVVPFSVEANL